MKRTATDPPSSSFTRWAGLWMPFILWLCVIFTASTRLGAESNSHAILFRFLGFFWRGVYDLPPQTQHLLDFLLRKTGHLTEYAIFAVLLLRALSGHQTRYRKALFLTLGGLAIYASSDELHQRFVPTRTSTPIDVCIDICGGCLGMLLYTLQFRKRKTRLYK